MFWIDRTMSRRLVGFGGILFLLVLAHLGAMGSGVHLLPGFMLVSF